MLLGVHCWFEHLQLQPTVLILSFSKTHSGHALARLNFRNARILILTCTTCRAVRVMCLAQQVLGSAFNSLHTRRVGKHFAVFAHSNRG